MTTKLKQAEQRISALEAEKSAADEAARKARKAFEDSDADPLDQNSDAFKAFDEAGRKRDELAEQLDEGRKAFARLRGSDTGDDTPAPDRGKQRGDDFLDGARRLEELGKSLVSQNDVYKRMVERGDFNGETSFGRVELGKGWTRDQVKALVGGAAPGGSSNLIRPERTGLLNLVPQRPIRILDLITSGSIDTKSIEYPVLIARGYGAGYVPDPTTAEPIDGTTVTPTAGGLKPETSVTFDLRTFTARTIASYIPVHRNMMEDAPFLEGLIDSMLRDELEQRLETDVISGSGSGETLRGVLNTSGIGSVSQGSDNKLDALHKAITNIRLQYEEPTGIAMHPSDWEAIRLMRDASGAGANTGQYLFGPPSQAGATTLWGLGVVATTAIPQGTPIVGDWSKATLWMRSGTRVLASDSHLDFFRRNLVALLAELRAAFGVTKPLAFSKVTFS